MRPLFNLFVTFLMFSLISCTTNPATYQKQRIEAQIGQVEPRSIKDWSGQNICIELTMNEPIFENSTKPEISLILKSINDEQTAKIGLMDVSRKNGIAILFEK